MDETRVTWDIYSMLRIPPAANIRVCGHRNRNILFANATFIYRNFRGAVRSVYMLCCEQFASGSHTAVLYILFLLVYRRLTQSMFISSFFFGLPTTNNVGSHWRTSFYILFFSFLKRHKKNRIPQVIWCLARRDDARRVATSTNR